MECGKCTKNNDADALFCEHCGSPLAQGQASQQGSGKRPYLYAAALVIVMVIVAAAGYYKFILPSGVAAEVNGEVITLAEVDGVVRAASAGQTVPAGQAGRMRFRVLSDLIAERVAWQEARKTGVTVTADEVDRAYAQAAGGDRAAFEAQVKEQYGSVRAFRETLERRIVIRKYITGTVAAGITDPAAADVRVGTWLQEATARADIRIAIAGQTTAGGGCSCCSSGAPSTSADRGCDPSRRTAGGAVQAPQAAQAEQAALAYWRKQHGDGPVQTKLTDFGCHIQVDIVKGDRIAQSLRYQDGAITEM
jgi:hypothetical protein